MWYKTTTPPGIEIFTGTEAPLGAGWEQDPDTLDTWFSSGLWTFSTLGWPEKTSDLKTFHPTDVLETGYDILFFWVARMILMSTYALEEIPFKKIYLHGIIRDKDGKKMSKSLGNSIDPVTMIEKYGSDAVRTSLIIGNAPGNDIKLSEEKIRSYKLFANKLWNITRFTLSNLDDFNPKESVILNAEDTTTMKEFEEFGKKITEYLETYKFYLAGEELYHYTWHTFADKIIESKKDIIYKGSPEEKKQAQHLLYTLLVGQIKMLHPFMPFITEEIWQMLPATDSELLMIAPWTT